MMPRPYAPSTLAGLRSAQNATGASSATGAAPSPAAAAPTSVPASVPAASAFWAAAGNSNDSQSGKRLVGMGGQRAVGRARQVARLHQPVDVAVDQAAVDGREGDPAAAQGALGV